MRLISAKILLHSFALSMLAAFSVAADCVAVPTGLVDLWTGDSTQSALASSPGSFRGAGQIGSGYIGSGFVFGGGADALRLPASFQLPSQEFTIETWVKRANTNNVGSDAEGGEFFAGSANGVSFGMTHTGVLYCGKVGVVSFYSTSSLRDTNWHHVAVTHATNALNFYADGALISTVSASAVFDLAGPYAIGGLGTIFGAYYGFLGQIDELGAYDRALVTDEIASIYAAGTAGKCAPDIGTVVSLPVVNPSFELLTGSDTNHFDASGNLLPGNYSEFPGFPINSFGFFAADAIPGWSSQATAGTINYTGTPYITNGLTGKYCAWINVHGQISQTLAATFAAKRLYRLSVDVSYPVGVNFPGYVIGLYANGQLVAADSNSINVVAGRMGTATVAVSLPENSPFIGTPIEIRLGIPGSNPDQVVFDNVQLTSASLGENISLDANAPTAAQPGTDFTATFVVQNGGAHPATNVALNVTLPTGFTLVTNTITQGTNVVGDTSIQSTIGIVEAGTAVTVTLTGHGGVATNLVFHGQVTRDGSDLTLADNQADVSVEILGPCLTAPSGLTLWLRGEGDANDELSHASTPAGVSYAPGKVGQAFSFDGTSEVAINDSPDLDQNSFTIETWVYPTSVDGAVDIIANKELVFPTTLSDTQFELGIKGPINDAANQIPVGNLSFFLSGISGLPNNYGGWVDAQANVPLNQWTHVALTVTPGTVTAYVNGSVSFSATNLTGSPVVNNGPLRLGSRNPQYVTNVRPQDRFNGRIDEFSFYGRALTGAEIASVYQAGAAGKCVQTIAASIIVPPTDLTVPAGQDATFGVVAAGTGPLTYQWKFKGVDIADATNSTLVVPAPRKNAAGAYSVTVCNVAGCTPPATANLTVTPVPAIVHIVNTTVQSPQNAVVPVQLIGNGVENALSFSLRFDTNRLTYLGTDLGTDAPDVQILVNDAQAARGILAVILALPSGSTFAEGTNDVLHLNFGTPLVSADLMPQVALLNSPTAQKISDATGTVLPGTWVNGVVTITAADFEGDVSPLPGGDRQLDISDWVQVGRYVAGLDDIAPGSIFQRADCAPLSTAGNGVLSVSDWVQAGRFAVGLDAAVSAGGPTGTLPGPDRKQPVRQSPPDRVVSFGSAALVEGLAQEIPVTITASGDENAVAFSVSYDPAVLRFVGAVKGAASKNAVLNVNTRHTDSGEVGVAMALTTGAKFPAGTLEIARLQFTAINGGSASTNLAFTDAPVVREVADPLAETLSVAWQASSFSVTLPDVNVRRLVTQDGPAIEVSWPTTYVGAVLETSDSLGGSWSAVTVAPTVANGQNTVVLPLSASAAYFHVKLP